MADDRGSVAASAAARRLRFGFYGGALAVVLVLVLCWRLVPRGWLPGGPAESSETETAVGDSGAVGEDEYAASPQLREIASLKRQTRAEAARLYQQHSDAAVACHVMAQVHYEFGETGEAVDWWQRSIERDAGFVVGYVRIASVSMDKAQYQEAETWYRQALVVEPSFSDAQFGLAESLFYQGKLAEARDTLEKSGVEVQPSSAPVLFLLGQIHLELEQYERAQERLEQAVRFMPNSREAYFALATVSTRLGEREQAAVYRQKYKEIAASAETPRDAVRGVKADLTGYRRKAAALLMMIGQAYLQLGDPSAAESVWRQAAAADPEDAVSRRTLVAHYQKTGRLREAIELLEQLSQLSPADDEYPLVLGQIHAHLQQWQEAEDCYRKALQLAPGKPAAYAPLVQLLLRTDRQLPEAAKLAAQAVELAPTAEHHGLLAITLERNGDRTKAREAVQKALLLQPDNLFFRQLYERLRNP